MTADRWLWEPDLYRTRLAFYDALAKQRRDDCLMREFAAFARKQAGRR